MGVDYKVIYCFLIQGLFWIAGNGLGGVFGHV